MDQLKDADIGAPLPTIESVLIIWPQISTLIAAMLVLFTRPMCCSSDSKFALDDCKRGGCSPIYNVRAEKDGIPLLRVRMVLDG
ncbi:hypothetical protein [Neorhizobium sp. DT-125]|uniref:hypothetical protein n=1 Tax=Neorhizobium sp. DT-125 TaxID=3396163 RepID=UPI003F1B4D48